MDPSPAMKQPADILHLIFRELYPPLCAPIPVQSESGSSVIYYTPHRVLSVISICRSWYSAGLSTLYRDIQITGLNQVPALMHTLNEPNSSFGLWVQSIDIHAVFPQDQETLQTLFVHPFTQLLHMCPYLKTLAFTTDLDLDARFTSVYNLKYPWDWYGIPFRFRCPIVTPPCNITHFYVNSVDMYAGLFDALATMSHTLVSLYIEDVDRDNIRLLGQYPYKFATSGTLTLTRLNTLSVSSSIYILKRIQTWEIPNLERLILSKKRGYYQFGGSREQGRAVYREFFSKFGGGIKVLDIYPAMFSLEQSNTLSYIWFDKLLSWVPALEHLIVHHSHTEKWPVFSSTFCLKPNVKWIDVCEEDQMFMPDPKTLDHIYSALGYFIHHNPYYDSQTDNRSFVPPRFPSLLGIRVFSQSLCHWNNLPHILLPWPTEGPEKVEYYPSSDFEPGWGPRKYEPKHDHQTIDVRYCYNTDWHRSAW